MSAPKFTPGPWVVNGFVAPDDLGDTKLEPTVMAGEMYVATAHDFGNSGVTSNANASLIATAPDLYAELEKSAALLNALLGAMPPALQKKWPNIVKRALESAVTSEAALAKARGEAP